MPLILDTFEYMKKLSKVFYPVIWNLLMIEYNLQLVDLKREASKYLIFYN